MISGPPGNAPVASESPSPPAIPAGTGVRAALGLLVAGAPHGSTMLNLHAVLNLLNRLNSTDEPGLHEDLVCRLADYLTALHRLETGAGVTVGSLCELIRSYAAMRFLMADAIEPGFEQAGPDLRLRTAQAPAMVLFLQRAIDSLLDDYVPGIQVRLRSRAWWTVELTLCMAWMPDRMPRAPAGWSPNPAGTRLSRSARFTALARPLGPP